MSPLGLLLLIVVLVLCLGGLPQLGGARLGIGGYGPSSMLFIVLIVLLVLVLTGRL